MASADRQPSEALDDIQGLVFFGYGSLKQARYLFFQIEDAAGGRAWLGQVAAEVTTAAPVPKDQRPTTSRNIALTAAGLKALGLDDDALRTFPFEFQDGMASGHRARILGDCVGSAPEHWQVGGPGNPPVHALLLLFARDRDEMEILVAGERARWEATNGAVRLVYDQPAPPFDGRYVAKEHFGFHDGISSTNIRGGPLEPRAGETPIAPGEFLLGYRNEYDKLPFTPTVRAGDDPGSLLPPAPDDASRRDLGRNGTYLVFRKLYQDVAAFRRFCDEQTRNGDGTGNPDAAMRLGAKMVGRWPSGAPLVLCPDAEDCPLGEDAERNNLFAYAEADPHGYRCPLGSHIRRSNPRDGLGPTPADSTRMVNRHRLLRRGRPYGPLLPDPVTEDDGADRGLVFICLNANIARQFEFVQQTWLNDPKFHGLYDNKDPIVGDNFDTSLAGEGMPPEGGPDIPYRFTIQGEPFRQRIQGIPRFVHVRGGGYFFLPGKAALRFLAQPLGGGAR